MAFDPKLQGKGNKYGISYIAKAMSELAPRGNNWKILDDDWSTLHWEADNPDDPPTEAQVATLAENLRKKDAYRIPRRKEYPPSAEQLDMQYHDSENGTTTWEDMITAVKTKFPKSLADSA